MATGATARYDGLADWYDARYVAGQTDHQPGLLDLLGPSSGPCLDIAREATRVLRHGGVLVVYGVHPCFNGPHVVWNEDGSRLVHASYRRPGWHEESPYWGDGIRRHVGMHHVTLAGYLNAFLSPDLTLERFVEPDAAGVPYSLAVRARRAC